MWKTIWPCFALIMIGVFAIAQPSEDIRNIVVKETEYLVNLASGNQLRISARYAANLVTLIDTSGDRATVQHPVDTRQYDVEVSNQIERMVVSRQNGELSIDHRFDRTYTLTTRRQVFRSFKLFSQSDRSPQIQEFIREQQRLLASEIAYVFERKIAEDEPLLIESIKREMNATRVRKISG